MREPSLFPNKRQGATEEVWENRGGGEGKPVTPGLLHVSDVTQKVIEKNPQPIFLP